MTLCVCASQQFAIPLACSSGFPYFSIAELHMSMPSCPRNTPFSLLSICDQSSQLPTFIPSLDISLLSANLCLFSLLTQPHIHPLTPASFTPSLTCPCAYPLTAFYLSISLLTHPMLPYQITHLLWPLPWTTSSLTACCPRLPLHIRPLCSWLACCHCECGHCHGSW